MSDFPSDRFENVSPFWRKVLALMSGSFLAQAINGFMILALARLYLPETFGLFGTFLAAVAVLAVIANFGFELTLMLPDSDTEAQGLLMLSLKACAVLSGILLLASLLLPTEWLGQVGLDGLQGWYLLVPLAVGFEGIIQPYAMALNRKQRYTMLTRLRVLRAVVTALVSLAGGLLDLGLAGLIVGYLAGQAATAVMSIVALNSLGGEQEQDLTWLELAKKYSDFFSYGIVSAWLNVASKQMIFFLLPGYYGEMPTGQFAKAERVLNLPPGLLSVTVGRVFYEEASEAARTSPQALSRITRNTARQMALLGLLVLIPIIWLGPELFAFVLGDPWTQAGEFARWLAPWLYLTMIASPLSFLIDVQRKLKEFLLFNALMFVARLGVLIWAGTRFEVGITIAWFGVVGAVMTLIQIIYLLKIGGAFTQYDEGE